MKKSSFSRMAIIVILIAGLIAPIGSVKAQTSTPSPSFTQMIQAQILQLQAQLQALQLQLAQQTPGTQVPIIPCTFTRNLFVGVSGEDVRCLQRYLNASGFRLATLGVGSPGNETMFYGALTRAAVARWQAAYGVFPPAGFFGPISRGQYSVLLAAGFPPPGGIGGGTPPPVPNPVTARLGVTAPAQPAATLAPQSAARIPVLRVTLTANSASDVTVRSLLVERRGLSLNTPFESLILIDEATGFSIGNPQTLSTQNLVTFQEPIVIPRSTSRTFTVAVNMLSSLTQFSGQIAQFALVGVTTANAVPVDASFPILGPQITVNSSLQIGTLTMERGPSDPGTSRTFEVGASSVVFSAVRATANSIEDLVLESVRWHQIGSIAAADLSEVRVTVNGTSVTATPSADGRFWSASFPGGITIPRGSSREIVIRGNIIAGTGRTVDFDISRETDIVARGRSFGFFVTPMGGNPGAAPLGGFSSTQEPFYNGFPITISHGTFSIERSNTVPAGSVVANTSNTPLGAFVFDIRGEAVRITRIVLSFATTGGPSPSDIRDVTIVDQGGTILAGPQDVESNGTVTFTTPFTLSPTRTTLTVRGRLGTAFNTNDTVTVSLNPVNITARGEVSGSNLTATPGSVVTANTQTVRDVALSVSVSPTPIAQSIVAGATNVTFARFAFDTTASGEDIRITSLRLRDTYAGNPGANDLTNCRIFRNGTTLTTGGNIVNPSLDGTSPDDFTFTMDSALTLPRNAVTTLELHCDVSSNAQVGSSHRWGINAGVANAVTAVGNTSGNTINVNVITSVGQAMTVTAEGLLSVTLDSSSPGERFAIAGSDNVALTVLRLEARQEAIRLTELGLILATSTASINDVRSVTLWNESNVRVGEAIFTGSSGQVTVILSQDFTIPANSQRMLTVKANLAMVGTNQPGTTGHRIAINYDGSYPSRTRGVGQSSGQVTNPRSTTTDARGVRLVKTFPIFELVSIPSTTLTNGQQILYRFKVTASANGDAGLYKLTFLTGTTGATLSNVSLHGYSDAGFSVQAFSQNPLNSIATTTNTSGEIEIYFNSSGSGSNESIHIPAGATRYFELRGTISGVTGSGASVSTTLRGDSAFLAQGFTGTAAQVDADANDNLIWSPDTFGSASPTSTDWLNGFLVPGVPSTGMSPQVLSQ